MQVENSHWRAFLHPLFLLGEEETMRRISSLLLVTVLGLTSLPAQAEESDTAPIGVVAALTGSYANYGEQLRDGMVLCNEEAKLPFAFEDSRSGAASGVTAFRKLLDHDRPKLVVVSHSPEASAIAPIARQQHVPTILTIVSSTKTARDYGDIAVRYFPPAEQDQDVISSIALDRLGVKQIGVLFHQSEYGMALRDAFVSRFTARGGVILEPVAYLPENTDFRSLLLRLAAQKPDALLLIGVNVHILNMLRQIRELKLPQPILNSWTIADPEIQRSNAELIEGVYFTAPEFYWTTRPEVVKFRLEFEQRFHRPPTSMAGIGCDIARMLAQNHEKSGAEIVAALRATRNYHGMMGELSASPEGDITFPMLPAQFVGGEVKPLNGVHE